MSNLTNEGQKYQLETTWRGAAKAARLFVGLTNAALSKTSVIADAAGSEPAGALAAPVAASGALAGAGAGALSNGAYSLKVAFLTAEGRTAAGTASNTVTVTSAGTDGKINWTAVPTGPAGTTARELYRTEAGGGTWKLLTTLNDNTTTSYLDNIADASLGAAAPSTNTTGQKAPPGAPTTALAGLGAGNLSAGEYKHLITFVTPAGETEAGTASAGVTVAAPGTDGQISLSAIPTGPYGVTARKIYRTDADGADYQLAHTLNDNTTTTWTDNVADASLGAAAPAVNTTAPNGYRRYEVEQSATGWPTSALDAGDWQLQSKTIDWTAIAPGIGPSVRVFLAEAASGASGRLLAFWDLSQSRTLNDAESLGWYGKHKCK